MLTRSHRAGCLAALAVALAAQGASAQHEQGAGAGAGAGADAGAGAGAAVAAPVEITAPAPGADPAAAAPRFPPPPPPPPEGDALVARLDRTLAFYGARERASRVANAGLSAAMGLGFAAGGAIALSNPGTALSPYTFGASLGLIAGGATTAALSLIGLAIEGPMERLLREHRAAVARGGRDGDAIAGESLRRWQVLADQQRSMRVTAGVLALAVSPLALGVGAWLLFSPPTLLGSPGEQVGYGLTMVTLGVIEAGLGVTVLITETPIEQSLEAFRRGAMPPTARSPRASLSALPIPGGGLVGVGLVF